MRKFIGTFNTALPNTNDRLKMREINIDMDTNSLKCHL